MHQKKWIFRSPITNWNGIAFCVIPSGGFDDNIVDYVDSRSYGRSSPGKRGDSYSYESCYVESYGNVVSLHEIGIDDSYGRSSPDFDNLDYSAYHVEMDGSILGNWYVTGSYGNHASPETIDDNDAYYIYTSGVVVLDDYTSNSYG